MKFEFLKKLNAKIITICIAAAILVIGGGTALALSVSGSGGAEISEQEAKAAAFAHAGISEGDVLSLHVSKSSEDGTPVYEIDFKTADRSYDYDVVRTSGEVLQSSYDVLSQDSAVQSGSDDNTTAQSTADTSSQSGQESSGSAVTQDQAKSIALQDAGVAESDTQFLWVKEDYDDGRAIYEVEFYANGTEYDYDIDKSTGKILNSDYDIENYAPDSGSGGTSDSTIISLEEARNIVLKRVSGATADDVRISLDRDDGRQIYEGEVYYDNMEYEFEIDASTGNVIEWSAERWD